jgi:flagellar basal-body rod protein FlgB
MNVTRDDALTVLAKGMDALAARQQAISHNIANVETPNYKAVDVAFEGQLRQALEDVSSRSLQRTHAMHLVRGGHSAQPLDDLAPTGYRRNQTTLRNDGNNVDVDSEMVLLAETALRFQAATTLASRKLAMMRLVAQESR